MDIISLKVQLERELCVQSGIAHIVCISGFVKNTYLSRNANCFFTGPLHKQVMDPV